MIGNSSALLAETQEALDGRGIDISIKGELYLQNGIISTSTFGEGNGGSISLIANSIKIIDNAAILTSVNNGGKGKGGDMMVKALDEIRIANGSGFGTGTSGQGDGGGLLMRARSLIIDGGTNGFSGIFGGVGDTGIGNSGDIAIETSKEIRITNGGQISVSTFGEGNGGEVSVSTRSLAIDGGVSGFAGIFAEVNNGGIGNGGNVDVLVMEDLNIITGGEIFANVNDTGIGNGGDVGVLVMEDLNIIAGGEILCWHIWARQWRPNPYWWT